MMKKVPTKKKTRTHRTKAPQCIPAPADLLRAQSEALKKLVSLEKIKQEFLHRTITPLSLDRLLASYLGVILKLTGTQAGSILLLDRDRLVFRAVRGPRSSKLLGKTLSLEEGIAGWVATTGRTYLSSDVRMDTRWSSRIGAELRFPTRNIMAAPLLTAENVIGVVEVINKTDDERPFDRADKVMLETLAGQMAVDVAYVQFLARSRRDAERKAMQTQFAMVLNSTLDQREVRRRAMEAATSLMDAEVGSLLLVDARTNELFFEVALGEKGEQLKQIRLRMGEGIAGWVAANDQAALVNDVQNDPRHFRKAQYLTNFVTRNMLCVPVRSRGRVLGVLQAINKKEGIFTDQDLDDFWTLSNQVAVALENANLYEELQETFLHTAEALAAAVEKKDPYTGGHIMRVVEYSLAIARHMAKPLSDIDRLKLAAVLHDIGKIGIKDSVLLKQGRLTADEMAHMREHPLVGDDILAHIEKLQDVRKVMRAHHEKWDGSGYPDGLEGESIPLHARIISVADCVDAMTTDRPYRTAANLPTAIEEVRRFSGKEFDPEVAEAFFRACEQGDIILRK